jgi:hypothetical protein
MKKSVPSLLCVLTLFLAIAACHDDPTGNEWVVVTLVADPAQVSTSESVEFTLTASASISTITGSRIDYEGDGTWDDEAIHNGTTVSATYDHRYDAEGRYTARVEVLEGLEVLDSDQVVVEVTDLGQRLVLQSLDSPPVTADIGPTGGCVITIPAWTAWIENLPTDPLNPPAPGWVRMYYVEIEYEWSDGAAAPATYVHNIGRVILLNETVDQPFNPITGSFPSDRQGESAQVKLTFSGWIEDATEIRLTAWSELQIEECP